MDFDLKSHNNSVNFRIKMEEDKQTSRNKNVLIGCTGSVASRRIPILVQELLNIDDKLKIKVIATEHSLHFFDHTSLGVPIYRDKDEWEAWKEWNDPVIHIELRRWADILVIAPLDANTLAKMANGLCDNLLTTTIRAWDLDRPLLFAPAMNAHMWYHPLTSKHIETLKGFGYKEISCITEMQACGVTGFGAMAEVSTIASTIKDTLQCKS